MKTTNEYYTDVHELLMKHGRFIIYTNRLAHYLNTDRDTAKVILEQHLLTRRTQHMTPQEIIDGLKSNDHKLNMKIVYSYKDLQRQHFNDYQKEAKKMNQLEAGVEESYTIDLSTVNKDTKEQVVELLPDLFREQATRDFIQSVLTVGKLETMKTMELDNKQFNQKMRQIDKYAKKHQEKFIGFVQSKRDKELIDEEKELSKLKDLIEDEDMYNSENMQQELKELDENLLTTLLDDKGYKHPGHLVENWDTPLGYRQDEYLFINKLYKRLDELAKQLKEDVDNA